MLTCALEQCLGVGGMDHHQWNGQLLDELTERYCVSTDTLRAGEHY